jgi:hypothetical protein
MQGGDLMDKTDLLLELCSQKGNEVKIIVKINDKIKALDIVNVIYDFDNKCFKLITK